VSPPGEPALVTRKTLVWRATMACLHVLYTLLWPTRVEGRERVPRAGRLVIVANHQSFLDIPLVARAVLHRHIAFVARDTLARSSLLGFVMRHCGTILLARGQADRAALRAMVAHLEAEDVVAVFPEGTRSPDGRLQPPKKGALVAARLAGAPILPCAIAGSYRAWPRGARFPRPGRLSARFGRPVDSARPDALEATWAQLAELLGEPAPPATDRTPPPAAPDAPGSGPQPNPPPKP